MMVLWLNDRGDGVESLQRDLNKFGCLLLVDGQFGGGTRDAVASAREQLNRPGPSDSVDDVLQQAVAAAPDPSPLLTAAGLTFIAREEVSDAATYRAQYQSPTFPPAASGITIGIGYDCRFVTVSELQADWGGILPAALVSQLAGVVGKQGTPELLVTVSTVIVPLAAAMQVFASRSVPKYLDQTRSIYPDIDSHLLTPAQRTALVSLVYNRGTDLGGDSRREMRAIRDLLAAERIDDVPDQFESMTRLWDPHKARGLIKRRRAEATLWRSGFSALQLG